MSNIISAPEDRPRHRLLVSGVALSALSFMIVLYTASEEPFFFFRSGEFALIAGLGSLVFLLFVAWAAASARAFRNSPRSVRSTLLVCASISWAAINLFYLGESIYGYAADQRNPRLGAPQRLPTGD